MDYFEKLCQITEYKPKSAMWNELTMIEKLRNKKVREKAISSMIEAHKNDKELGTELTLFLNWKMWQKSEEGDIELSKLYQKFWEEIYSHIEWKWKIDDLRYFLEVTG